VEWLIAARFVQAFTGAAGMVISRAIVPDITEGKAAARAFSLIFMVLGVAPVIAPVVGGALAGVAGWRAIFWSYAALVLVAAITVHLLVPETNPRERRAQARDSSGTARPLGGVLRSRAFVGYALAFACSFAALMAYMAASPFVFQVMGGLGPVSFGALYGAIAVVLIVSSAVSARLARTHEVSRLLGVGLSGFVVAALGLGALVAMETPALLYALPIAAAVACLGLVFGNASALALGAVPQVAGTASAILGLLQFGLSGAVIPLVSIRGEETAVPLAVIMVTAAVGALIASGWAGIRTVSI
jgi:DHA1 family bicyclomycin/chloramphenicol resistance-like MFS transporter